VSEGEFPVISLFSDYQGIFRKALKMMLNLVKKQGIWGQEQGK
jgi:hypothetical protein